MNKTKEEFMQVIETNHDEIHTAYAILGINGIILIATSPLAFSFPKEGYFNIVGWWAIAFLLTVITVYFITRKTYYVKKR